MRTAQFVRPLKIVGVLYIAYLALVLLVATPVLNFMAPKLYRSETGRELRLDKIIWLNPFTLALTVRGAGSDNADKSRFWSVERLYANLSLSSLWRRQLVLDTVQLQGLYLQVDQTAADRYNFSDILDYRAAQPQQKKTEPTKPRDEIFPISIAKIELGASHLGLRAPHLKEPLAIEIGALTFSVDNFSTVTKVTPADKNSTAAKLATSNVSAAVIDFAAGKLKADFLRDQQPFSTQIDNVHFSTKDFATALQEDQSYQLLVKFDGGGELQTQGKFSLAAHHNSGELHLRNISLLPAWRYLAPKLSFETQRALLDADIPYQLTWGENFHYSVSGARAALRDVQLQSLRDADTHLGFSKLSADGIAVDSKQAQAQLSKISIDGLKLKGWNKETRVSLLDMFQFLGSSEEEDNGPAWQVQLDEFEIPNAELRWQTSHLDVAELIATPLSFRATQIHWPTEKPLQFDLKTTVNTSTQLAIAGAVNPTDLTGKLSGDIAGLPLPWTNHLLGQQVSATLQSGIASAHFELALDKGQPTTLQSDGRIDQFEMQRLPDQQKLLAWKQLQWKKLAINLPKRRLNLDQLIATNPWLQFRINNGGTNNLQQLIIDQPPAVTSITTVTKTSITTKPAAVQPATTLSITSKPAETSAETINLKIKPTETKAAVKSSATMSTKSSAGAAAVNNKPWRFTVRNIHTDNGLLDFRDNSLARAFHTTIADFTGDIDGLSNRRGAVAKVGFKGTVDGYAPVALTGTANPFAETRALNVTLDIANLDLAALTPYSGTYAGYTINGGRLSVQLAYTLEDQRIKGTNHIIVNNLDLGEQVRGPKVMDLPLRFAIYLLTDSNGVMDLGVDVTGNVDDPDFSVASIIWKAFRNVIIKTATSPFRALGNLVGSGDQDLDRVEFNPGSDKMGPANNDKLNSLSKALEKKPALRLNISGHVSPWQDIEALRDNSLSQALIQANRISTTDIQQQSKGWQQAVADLYKKRFPADKSGKLETMQMNDAMRDNVELDPRALDELAGRRALAVKQALVTEHTLAADRATVAPVDLGADKNPGLHATMTVE